MLYITSIEIRAFSSIYIIGLCYWLTQFWSAHCVYTHKSEAF